jgi:phosphoribosylglycinamide formyltransferase 1
MDILRVAIFASGSGSNAQRIMEYFADSKVIKIDCLLSNNPSSYALERAKMMQTETMVFTREQFYDTQDVENFLHVRKINLVVLAGFLWLIPEKMVQKFKIVNIHPALLPKYGGKNMYGMRVHEAVIRNGETVSGITIHHVNEKYDEGAIIFQATCPVDKQDTPESLVKKIHQLEHAYYPKVIEDLLVGAI